MIEKLRLRANRSRPQLTIVVRGSVIVARAIDYPEARRARGSPEAIYGGHRLIVRHTRLLGGQRRALWQRTGATSTSTPRVGGGSWSPSPGRRLVHHPAWAMLIAHCYRLHAFVAAVLAAPGTTSFAGRRSSRLGRPAPLGVVGLPGLLTPTRRYRRHGPAPPRPRRAASGRLRSIEISERWEQTRTRRASATAIELALDAATEETKGFNGSPVQHRIPAG